MNQLSKNHSVLRASLHKFAGQLAHLPAVFELLWKAAGRWSTAWILLLISQGLLPVATVYLTRAVVDSMVAAIQAQGRWETAKPALILVGLMAGLMLVAELLSALARWVRTAQAELLQDHISEMIHEKSASVDLEFYDSTDFYDHLHRARSEASYRPIALLENTGGLLQSAITLTAMLIVLLPFGLWLPVALLLSTLPALYTVLRYTLRQHDWHLEATSRERQGWYYDELLTTSDSASELRLFGLGQRFRNAFNELRRGLRDEKLALERDQGLAQLGAATIGLCITGATMAWMVWQALQGYITLGSIALFYQAFNQGQRMMRSLLENTGQIYYNVLFLGNLFEFLELQPKLLDPTDPAPVPTSLRRGIQFNNVTFRYPTTDRLALNGFNLTIAPGQVVAIVGRNGAGKSTLTKLLCRFYDPNNGHISIDDIDLRDFSLEGLRRAITVLFQEPVHYQASASDNIVVGEPTNAPDDMSLHASARAAGADKLISALPQSYQTLLGRRFGGVELSVGEWQRLALARAFLRKSPIMVLDEPTSAMDSWAEADWMKRFRTLASGRTAIIITHRFTTAMQADVIHVMDNGRLVESGSHQELVARGGLYAESWRAQVGGRRSDV